LKKFFKSFVQDAEAADNGFASQVVFNGKVSKTDYQNFALEHVYCGNALPDDYYSTSRIVLIKFKTDDKDTRPGFRISAYAINGDS